MQTYAVYLFSVILMWIGGVQAESPEIVWYTNYEAAVQRAEAEEKPLLLLFTGSDWCLWCQKLEQEVFVDPAFVEKVGKEFVFVKLDFPLRKAIPAKELAQNEKLKDKFDVKGFPTLIMLDASLQQIDTMGYRPGGGEVFGKLLLKALDKHRQFQQSMRQFEKGELSSEDLSKLYDKTRQMGMHSEMNAVMAKGLKLADNLFFMKERYRQLVEEGKIDDPKTRLARQELLAKDPENLKGTHRDVAVIDFEGYAEDLPRMDSPNECLAPLLKYLKDFGAKDSEMRWRIEMTVAQVFMSKKRFEAALDYAGKAYESAPSTTKPDIAKAMEKMRRHIETNQES